MKAIRRILLALLLSFSMAGLVACDDVGAEDGIEESGPTDEPLTLEEPAD